MEKELNKAAITEEHYSSADIDVLEGLEGVRARPAMYIGSTDTRGLHHLVYEIVDNSVDEALAGVADTITVTLGKDGSATICDNGRGIPVDIHPKVGKSALEVVLTMLHAGGKFRKSSYMISTGLHGVGASVVNALSEIMEVWVKKDGKEYYQAFSKGKSLGQIRVIGDAVTSGTTIRFKPDPAIFKETQDFCFETLSHRFEEVAYLTAGLKLELIDERDGQHESFHFEGGIKSMVEHMNVAREKIHEDIIYLKKETPEKVQVEVAMQYTDNYSESIYSFANNVNTADGGTHMSGLKSALTKTINDYARSRKDQFKDFDENLMGDDVREGLTAVISIKLPEPQFEGQTKAKLGNSEVKGIVESSVTELLAEYLEENPRTAKAIIMKCLSTAKARKAAQKAKDLVRRKSELEISALPGKLADCSDKDPSKCEIFLVEGDSAGGSAKSGRDRRFQAIMPLRGKVINVYKADIKRVLENNEIRSIITALDAGFDEEGPNAVPTDEEDNGNGTKKSFNLDSLRYHKVVIMTDADIDGAHIRTLLLTFFYRYMPDLIREGHIYIAQPPLYKIKAGKIEKYVYSDEELQKALDQIGRDNYNIQRYKGLGEMNAEQLWETTMNPETRTMFRVAMEDARKADELFSILMGDAVEPRRKFIETHAIYAKNIDI
ncbi:MAG TPA: DNA topoisomerase (ATP-hydrolyzing) subunit B [Bacillota bacterium]|nr:DNA topoisomerase (ATP-hydrolyzing) subunit B [Bacillota bacterium]HOH10875.1 DNA topoisomerase (ATP-hydrolyzing) subunit B [Bacillota bacterium]HOS49799.1 DNA topoisomerase (ATP-hydrolyzing) subunit B [Bacillota bacterium]HOY88348.1 DNA topoisomerase (ATP-hydrolyzing) subunit B [Bacillota bacterium]HPI00820.1 DNA topoisomerase (ATP-hydrolyzing) subunit B [Bacillota bacterium]